MNKHLFRRPTVWIAAAIALQMPVGIEVPSDTSRVTEVPFYSGDSLKIGQDGFEEPFAARDGPGTTFRVAGGGGSFMIVTRDCEGRVIDSSRHSFGDLGAEVNHRFKAGVELGLRGGYVENGVFDEYAGAYYVNPYIAPETRNFGLGMGVIVRFRDDGREYYPSGHLRIGPRSGHFSFRVLEGLPLSSGAGVVDLGVGWQSSRAHLRGWTGLSAGTPYDGLGILFNLSLDASNQLEIGTNLRFGFSSADPEYGAGLVLGWRPGR